MKRTLLMILILSILQTCFVNITYGENNTIENDTYEMLPYDDGQSDIAKVDRFIVKYAPKTEPEKKSV